MDGSDSSVRRRDTVTVDVGGVLVRSAQSSGRRAPQSALGPRRAHDR
jgi:hypothetical protein